jgi:TonB family protein
VALGLVDLTCEPMSSKLSIALLLVLALCACAAAQEQSAAPGAQPGAAAVQAQGPTAVDVHQAGKDASFPELLPTDLSSAISDNCEHTGAGEVELSFIVDAEGKPHNVMLVRAVGNDLDLLSLSLARGNRFKPALMNGSPVAVALTDKVKLWACAVAEKNAAGQNTYSLRYRSQPEQHLSAMTDAPAKAVFSTGGLAPTRLKNPDGTKSNVIAPVPILTFNPEFSEEARRKGVEGEVMIQVIVDAYGFPLNPRVVRPVGSGLDEKALEAVKRYRFKPALRDGIPVPVFMTIAINFRLCRKTPCQ